MKVIKPNRLSCLTRPYRYLNTDYLAVTAYAMVDFSSDFHLDTEQRLWGIFNEESVRNFDAEVLDFGIPKRTPEIILNGYGFGKYAVQGRTAVSVTVNNVRKDLWVTGDRYWSDGRPSPALPFEKIAINWRNAYGGPGFEENPRGKGHRETEIDGLRVRFLPNIEDPARPVAHEGQRHAPAGYCAIPVESPGRNRMLGTYDDHWRVREFPGFARDIDWAYFNQSPPRQRLDRLQAGDRIVFTHLHPDKETLATTVPPLAARAFIKKAAAMAQEAGFLEEVPLRLTTYWAYPHLEKAILLYQGAVPVDEDDASDVSHILYAAEHSDSTRAPAYYEDVFRQRVHPETGPFHALLDKQLVDARFIRHTASDEIELSPLLRNKLRKLEQELARNVSRGDYPARPEDAARLDTELAWLAKSRNGKIARDDIIEDLLRQQRPVANLKAARKELRARRQVPRQDAGDVPQAAKDEQQRFLEARRTALLASLRKDAEQRVEAGAGSRALDSHAAQEQLRQLRLQQLEQFEDTVLRAPGAARAGRAAGGPRRLHRVFGLNQLATEPLPAGHDGYELRGFAATRVSYAGWNLDGLTIRESRITGCDFSKARMADCRLDQVVFEGCDFASADWSRARFRQCQFIDCRLPDVQSDKAQFEDCRFERSELSAWMHFRISLKNCVFERCRFVNFSCMRGGLQHIAFRECDFLRHAFIQGKMTGLRMEACRIDSMSFVGLPAIRGFQLAGCRASKLYIAPESAILDADISHSTVSASSFRKVHFDQGAIIASDLSTCDFSEARLQGIRLADSFFKQSLFIRADLSGASVTNADFSEAQMKAADLAGTQLRHVSFFSAELSMIRADSNTVQQDMLMDRSNIYPVRK
ncbi:DUF2169 family type VI secretion system accessory protein [Bordetella petrii]|uniref:DUF2169 domain-containing protein n=1 Tax=Bordetella petrii TaxID=94624 RepID=A0ABT7W7U3_9BORD|nr:pentapeptide repeat-containing protein [Bordetella petrii]MDM9561246.1 DUF2169 domain-containing protein [Bordetella petrii]